jgi:hypothetical protein
MASGVLRTRRLRRHALIIAKEVEADDRLFARLDLDQTVEREAPEGRQQRGSHCVDAPVRAHDRRSARGWR